MADLNQPGRDRFSDRPRAKKTDSHIKFLLTLALCGDLRYSNRASLDARSVSAARAKRLICPETLQRESGRLPEGIDP